MGQNLKIKQTGKTLFPFRSQWEFPSQIDIVDHPMFAYIFFSSQLLFPLFLSNVILLENML